MAPAGIAGASGGRTTRQSAAANSLIIANCKLEEFVVRGITPYRDALARALESWKPKKSAVSLGLRRC